MKASRSWPLWVAFVLLVSAVLLLLLRACGLVLPGYGTWHHLGLAYCAPVERSAPTDEHVRGLGRMALELQLRIAQRRAACLEARPPAPPPPQREAALPPPDCRPYTVRGRLMMIFDTSGSMGLPMDADPDEMERVERGWAERDPATLLRVERLLQAPGRKRLDEAKSSALELIASLPPRLDVGLLSFAPGGDCQLQLDVAPTPDRAGLAAAVRRLQAKASTPLAAALARMREAMAGAPAGPGGRAVVVITDGQESCHGDPCAEAEALHHEFPDLRIHVIDITGKSKLQCVATATQGTIATATNVEALKAAIARTRSEMERPAGCPSQPD